MRSSTPARTSSISALGTILWRRKKITREQRDRIDAVMQRDGGQFGKSWCRPAYVRSELRDWLKVQVSEIVYDAFVWEGGTFSFAQETSLPRTRCDLDRPRQPDHGRRAPHRRVGAVPQALPDQSMIFRVVAAPRDEKITLTAEEWKILS